MRVPFACPSCHASGSAESAYIGREVRCKHCNTRFTIPDPESPASDTYDLEERAEPVRRGAAVGAGAEAVFVPSRKDDRPGKPRKAKGAAATSKRRPGRDLSDFPWTRWLIRLAVAFVVAVAGIALIAPNGLWLAGCILMATGVMLLVLGHVGGTYVAFTEDFVHGFFYLGFPIYTAYYIVTNWDDMWVFFACSTVGAGLASAGLTLVEWAGAAA
ncbi:hypothetical protein [Aquisphaera insulae]|uniref:hypothetical protein n=1 Tax=Aquisphaera insulae TaxID=2712864 RepID=UPI0013EAC9CD|nr:hypothetical protein [Aquisphaera insulae]